MIRDIWSLLMGMSGSLLRTALEPTWSTHGAKECCVKPPQCIQRVLRDISAMLLVIFCSPWNMGEFEVECVESLGQLLHYLNRSANDLRSDAITGDGSNSIRRSHCEEMQDIDKEIDLRKRRRRITNKPLYSVPVAIVDVFCTVPDRQNFQAIRSPALQPLPLSISSTTTAL